MKFLSVLFLAGSVMGVGQQPCPSGYYLDSDLNQCFKHTNYKFTLPAGIPHDDSCIYTVHNPNVLECTSSTTPLKSPIPKPLKCGKYQHVVHEDAYCGGSACKGNGPCVSIAVCHPEVNECADDMHPLTEKEWQELMQRIKVLEDVAHFVLRPQAK